ncbi:PAS domain S-box protein, partial [Candidatus Bathyarchaeota archaeon]|nr:PAS domain S-box protein [Candidatus Bathyarchaeota archaeon]
MIAIALYEENGGYTGTMAMIMDIAGILDHQVQEKIHADLEDIVAWVTVEFMNLAPGKISEGIDSLLGDLGSFFNLDSILFLKYNDDAGTLELEREWEVSSIDGHLARVDLPKLIKGTILNDLKRDKCIDMKHLPVHASSSGILAELMGCIVIPATFHGHLHGAFAFQSYSRQIRWKKDIVFLLKRIGLIIASALSRARNLLQLQKREEMYRTLFQSAKDLIFLLQPDGKIMSVNQSFISTMHYTQDELVGKDLGNIVVTADKGRLDEIIHQLFSGDSTESILEIQGLTKEGTSLPLEISFSSLARIFEDVRFVGIARDLTKRKEAERLTKIAYQRLKKMNELRKEFIANTSHELKTPLTVLCGASQMLTRHFHKLSSQEMYKYAKLIDKGALRLRNLILNFVDFSKIETGQFKMVTQKVDLVSILQEVLEMISEGLDEHGHHLKVDVPRELVVLGDKPYIEKVILNLITNAVKNSPNATHSHVRIFSTGTEACFSVRDHGVGLTEREKHQLFKKFGRIERENTNTSIQGAGLGLFISKEIITKHGGR